MFRTNRYHEPAPGLRLERHTAACYGPITAQSGVARPIYQTLTWPDNRIAIASAGLSLPGRDAPRLTDVLTTHRVPIMSERLTTTTRPFPQADANLGYLFRLAHQRFRALLESELEHLGLSAQEYGILSVFETRPELSTAELARISQVTRQTMHTSVLSLEAAGLVERRAKNQRVVLVRPTNRGRTCLETATRRVRAVEHAALADLSREDERTVRTWLASVAALTTSPTRQRSSGRTSHEPSGPGDRETRAAHPRRGK